MVEKLSQVDCEYDASVERVFGPAYDKEECKYTDEPEYATFPLFRIYHQIVVLAG